MKNLIIILVLLIATNVNAQTSNEYPIYNNVHFTNEFNWQKVNSNQILIPSPFAKAELEFSQGLDLKNNRIKKITYYYSQNKSNPNFSQNNLSNERFIRLVAQYPQVNSKDVDWETAVQNNCENNNCAKDLFHGFVIELEPVTKLVQKLKPSFGHDQLKDQTFRIDASIETVIIGEDGTKILVPANAFIDSKGRIVDGKVTVTLKEALNIEDIVLGNLNTITSSGEALLSKGMVKIEAFKGRYALELARGKSLTVEIPTTYEEGYSYYQGDSKSGELKWNKPVQITKNPKVQMNNRNRSQWGFNLVKRSFIDFVMTDKVLDTIIVHHQFGDQYYTKADFSMRLASRNGVNQKIGRVIQEWFDADEVDLKDLNKKKFTTTWTTNLWFPLIWWRDKWDGKITQFLRDDSEVGNILSVNKLGWANIDCLARMKNTRMISFNVNVDSDVILDDFKIALIVPKLNSMIPGFRRDNGAYAFTHGENEDKVKMPKGEDVFVMVTGKKNEQQYFAIKKFKLGEHAVEQVKIVKVEREAMLKELKETL